MLPGATCPERNAIVRHKTGVTKISAELWFMLAKWPPTTRASVLHVVGGRAACWLSGLQQPAHLCCMLSVAEPHGTRGSRVQPGRDKNPSVGWDVKKSERNSENQLPSNRHRITRENANFNDMSTDPRPALLQDPGNKEKCRRGKRTCSTYSWSVAYSSCAATSGGGVQKVSTLKISSGACRCYQSRKWICVSGGRPAWFNAHWPTSVA
jgi:hypothetical protein